MRFQFCGELDCPDWVLAGVNLLSRVSSLKLRTLCSLVLKSLLGEELDMAKIHKATADAKLTDVEVRAAVAVVQYVLESAARHAVASEQLDRELQQLGLPREHTAALCRALDQQRDQLRRRQHDRIIREPGVSEVQWEVSAVRDSAAPDSWKPEVALTLQLTDSQPADPGKQHQQQQEPRELQLVFSPETASVLRRELLLARQRMEDVS